MNKEERRARLVELMQEGSRLSVADVASELGCSQQVAKAEMSAVKKAAAASPKKPSPKKTKTAAKKTGKKPAPKKTAKSDTKPPKIKFSDRLQAVIKKAKKAKDGSVRIPAADLEAAGFSKSAYVYAAYWRSYNNTGTKSAAELGFKASLTTDSSTDGGSARVLVLTPN
jgi:hypothetical protein